MGTAFGSAREDHSRQTERFRLDKLVGQGGMGAVYKAYDQVLDRVVAIKLLHAALAQDEEAVRRLKREIQLASRISHPNVLRVYDFGEMHGTQFISMAYVAAPTLRELIKEGSKLDRRKAVSYAIQICRALQAAHEVGVIHRDLKPQNVLVDSDDHVVVADFGLAKGLDEEVSFLSLDQRPGTPSYMSPEQRLGLPVDQRTDIYSFGTVLYEMLTGELLLSADAAVDLAAASPVVSADDGKLAASGASPELIRLVVRSLSPAPEERYAEVKDILAELEPILGAESEPRPAKPNAPARRWTERVLAPQRFTVAAGAFLVVALALGWGLHLSFAVQGDGFPAFSPASFPNAATPAVSELSALAPYRKARDLLAKPQSVSGLEDAIGLLESAVEEDPGFVPAQAAIVEVGLMLYRETADRRWIDRAERASEAARIGNAELPQTKIALARMHLAKGAAQDAHRLLRDVVSFTDGSEEAYRLLAQACLRLNSPLEAIESAEKAVQSDPSDWRNHQALGATFYGLQRLPEAEAAFREMLTLNPDIADAANNLGVICLQMGRFDEAVSWFEKSLRLRPKPESYSNIGTSYFLAGRYELAMMAFEKAVSLRPGSDVLMGNLAVAYQLAGQHTPAADTLEHAISLVRSALEIYPNDREAKRRLALYYARGENLPDAEALVEEIREEAPTDVRVLYADAVIRLLGGKLSGALETLDLALQAGYPAPLAFADPTWRVVSERPQFEDLRETYWPDR